jgi:hypothetical protein
LQHVTLRRLRSIDQTRAAFALHVASLIFAFAFLLYVNRNQWFNGDEWGPLAYRRLIGGDGYKGLFDPVGGAHWGTLTILSYRFLFTVFGVRTYLPYVAVMVAFQVLAMHMLWRVALKAKVEPLVAAFGTAVFGILACGYSIITQGAGLYQTASIALGLAAVLVVPDEGPLQRRDAVAALLALGSLMFFSGVGIPMLLVLALRVLLTRGPKIAAAVVAGPAFALFLWIVIYLPKAGDNVYSDPFGEFVRKTPELAWRGLVASVDQTTMLPGIGPVVLVLAFGWALRRAVLHTAPWPLLLAVTAGGIIYLPLIALGRSGLGVEAATASRYLYTIVAFVLPILLAAGASILSGIPLRVGTVVVIGLALMSVQVTNLNRVSGDRATVEQQNKRGLLATVQLLRAGEKPVRDAFVQLSPIIPLSFEQIRALADDGALPDGPEPSTPDLLDARVYLQVAVTREPVLRGLSAVPGLRISHAQTERPSKPGCRAFSVGASHAIALLRFPSPGAITVRNEREAKMLVHLLDRDARARSRDREIKLREGEQSLNVGTKDALVVLSLPKFDAIELCPAG